LSRIILGLRERGAERGMTVLEVVVAAFILLVAATAVFTAMYSGLRLQATSKQRATATSWADHLLELARNQRYDSIGLSDSTAAIAAVTGTVPAGDVDNPDRRLRRDTATGCLEFNAGTGASPAWERLILSDWYTPPSAAANCATQTATSDFHLRHSGGSNDYVAAGSPTVTYTGWVFVTWAAVAGQADVYYKRVTVVVRHPSPTGGISRLVQTSSLFSLGYVPAVTPSTTSAPTTTVAPTTTAAPSPSTTLPPGCAPQAGDILPPAGRIDLAGGNSYTNQLTVDINNSVDDLPHGSGASGLATMAYSNLSSTAGFQPSPPAAYGAVHGAWPVGAGDGVKSVWGMITDCNGNQAVFVDTITLDQTRPPAPVLSGSAGKKQLSLSWTAATDPGGADASGVASYRVYRSDKGPTSPLATVPASTLGYDDKPLTSGLAYTYWVTAVDAAGNESQPESSHYTGIPT